MGELYEAGVFEWFQHQARLLPHGSHADPGPSNRNLIAATRDLVASYDS